MEERLIIRGGGEIGGKINNKRERLITHIAFPLCNTHTINLCFFSLSYTYTHTPTPVCVCK